MRDLYLLLAFLFSLLNVSLSSAYMQESRGTKGLPCNMSIAECYKEDDELLMYSETGRRILQQTPDYISYRGFIPDRPVAGSGRSGKPYTRGCEKVYGCRSGG